ADARPGSGAADERRVRPLRRRVLVPVYVVVAGTVLGVLLAELAGYLPRPWFFLSQMWTPWLLAGFVAGCLCRRPIAGALAGTSVLGAGLAAYVSYKVTQYGAYSVRPLADVWGYW